MRRGAIIFILAGLGVGGLALGVGPAALSQSTQHPGNAQTVEGAQAQMAAARREGTIARQRAEKLEAQARDASLKADRTAHEAAALAARIQETEASLAAKEGEIHIIDAERTRLRYRLAERQAPLVRLTAALQKLSRRPPVLALLRPGSLRETVYMRALLDSMVPEIERRSAGLRKELARSRELSEKATLAAADLRSGEVQLRQRRRELSELEARQRIASRAVSGSAAREAERALALAERTRDLGDLVDDIGKQGKLREALAALPGPILRPSAPDMANIISSDGTHAASRGISGYILPVSGKLVTGFGEQPAGRVRSRGLSLATRANAQAVAPAEGRVAFAGRYRGYGLIVIIEHEGGWTSLVTGLARLDVAVGDDVVSGAPIGVTGAGLPVVTVELRQEGNPVNPLDHVTAS